jgi:hypothetical protein
MDNANGRQNNFVSMLPRDIAARKKASEQVQHTIDSHLVERKPADRVLPYTDQAFMKAAIEWLISTNQVHDSEFPLIITFMLTSIIPAYCRVQSS